MTDPNDTIREQPIPKDSSETISGFQRLFRGRTDAWGSVTGMSNKELVTEEHYKKHLEAKVSLGIYPLMDDGRCYFAVFDLDTRDWLRAISIQDAYANLRIPAYITLSKSKGYHIWIFSEENEPFIAKEVRLLALGIMQKLSLEIEFFPKQDTLDKMVPLGNYINLPGFGVLSTLPSRKVLDRNQKEIPFEDFLNTVKRTPRARIPEAIKEVPPMITQQIIPTKARAKKGQHPPCIESLLKGVGQGARDVAAFALARHYLDQGFLPPEVLGLLLTWDRHNSPPLGQKGLDTKTKSAEKGYAFGCHSIQNEALLSYACVGEEKCEWLKAANTDKRKKGLIQDKSFYESETHLYEEILPEGATKAVFLAYKKETGEIEEKASVTYGEVNIMPIFSAEITERAVTLPSGVEEYGDTVKLVGDITTFVKRYVDMPESDLEFAAWYIIMTWVYDKLEVLSYLRFLGDSGTGKSRGLDVIGRICYKPIMVAGAVTPAPIYRLIRKFRGTLILEEADFRDSTEKSEVVTILNSGFELGRPVIRCSADNPNVLEILPCFGPKVFATRFRFNDVALESRCFTITMEETDRDDIFPILGKTFRKEAAIIRNKLLLWRLRNLASVDCDDIEKIDLGGIEPRLKQIGIPFAIPFKNMPEVMARFTCFLKTKQAELKEERSRTLAGQVVNTFFRLALADGRGNVSSTKIAEELKEESKGHVSRILTSLNMKRRRKRPSAEMENAIWCVVWEDGLMRKLLRRYVIDPREYDSLFEDGTENKKLDMEV